MMDADEEFRLYMKAAMREMEHPPEQHATDQDLIAYEQGTLSGSDRERVQTHLAACETCRANLQDVRDLFGPPQKDEPVLTEAALDDAWQAFQSRLPAEASSSPARVSLMDRWFRGPWRFAFEAGLAAAASILLVWGNSLRLDRNRLISQLQVEQQNMEKARSEAARLREPQLNARVYDVYPAGMLERSQGSPGVAAIDAPAGSRLTLMLNAAGLPRYGSYTIQFLSPQKEIVWQGAGLQRDRHDNFVVNLDPAFLGQGEYWIHVLGSGEGKSDRIAEYRIRLKTLP